MKSMLRAFGLIALLLGMSAANAAVVVGDVVPVDKRASPPTFTVTYGTPGGQTQTLKLDGSLFFDPGTGTFGTNLVNAGVDGVFSLNGTIAANADPFVEYSLGVKNFTGGALDFLFGFASPYALGPYATLQSSHSSTVTDGSPTNGAVTVTPFGGSLIHRPEIDAAAAPGAFGSGCSPTGSPGFSTSCNPFADGSFAVATAVSGTFGVDVGFTLSAGDLYSMTGRVELSSVPEPGTWALMLAGLVGLVCMARRRAA